MSTSITSDRTEGQATQYRRMMEDISRHGTDLALEQVVADSGGWQRVLEHGDELKFAVAQTIVEKTRELSLSNQYANEEVSSNYTYPPEYQLKPFEDQIKAVASIFGLDPTSTLEYAGNLPALPDGAEGWFAIPSVDALAMKHFPEVTDPAEKYCRAVQLVHAKIAASRSFYNYRKGQITPDCLRVPARTVHAFEQIAQTQKGEILIVAAQLGLRHRGRSVRRAREVFVANEFGLGSLFVGAIVLTHPERYVRWEQLHTDCDDEFASDADGDFSNAPYLHWFDGELEFNTYWVGNPNQYYGLVSAFLPQ
ncbi:MAG: Uncharacterized protein CEN92_174 [Candidatus Berkelbacteria bacterium Licking1014_96]|uniref:Uncharacterized protein n=1 Tax=Candidatus Berkelbacteria bacterium Licking1014_96 TaxID=2017149 RepID=A0A554LG80_9BACT|nr:MAG: Uncharacterized protein CEN92_174 [Candidatus Berkelbacteria bacterium Licking1014_96]